jgi:hypothetical protein
VGVLYSGPQFVVAQFVKPVGDTGKSLTDTRSTSSTISLDYPVSVNRGVPGGGLIYEYSIILTSFYKLDFEFC